MRAYLEDGLGIPAPRRTTEEVLADAALPLLLREVLAAADRCKFAGWPLSHAAALTLLEQARTFVIASAPETPAA